MGMAFHWYIRGLDSVGYTGHVTGFKTQFSDVVIARNHNTRIPFFSKYNIHLVCTVQMGWRNGGIMVSFLDSGMKGLSVSVGCDITRF